MGANKVTVAVLALIAVCLVSFVAFRSFAKSEQINNPTFVAGTTNNPYQVSTTAPQPTSTSSTTQPTSSDNTSDPNGATDSSSNIFTTFDVSTTIPTMPTTVISQPTTTTTIPTTSTTQTTQKVTTTIKDPNISEAIKENDGFMGYLYNETGNYYYTNKDPWQRVFGFNAAYDFGAQFVFMFYDTARIKFTYDNKDWMIETWKGQYGGVFIGAEIGVYYKPTDRTVEHYDCVSDDDTIYMEMALYREGQELLSREYDRYWWCTGFVPGKLKKYSDRSELTLKARITMPNRTMLRAFVRGLEECAEYDFVEGKSYKVDGLDVFINW